MIARMSRRLLPALLAVALVAAACSAERDPKEALAPARSSSPSAVPSASPGASDPAAVPGASRSTGRPRATIPAPAGAPIPPTGEYVYAQHGSETFCSAAACSTPRALPPMMTATVRYGGTAGAAGHAIELELRVAPGRIVRVRSRYSPHDVTLSEIAAEFTESGFTQSGAVRPTPPIELLKFPLTAGSEHTQRFTDGETSGTFTRRVRGLETINAGGRRVQASRIDSTLTTAGETPATIGLTMWVDEATRTFLRLTVSIDATYQITRYKASFTDTLQTAPR